MRLFVLPFTAAAIVLALSPASAASGAQTTRARVAQRAIAAAVASSDRRPASIARDRYRHPAETLAFMGATPDSHIVEIWPAGGWYTEILAPLTASGKGSLWVTAPNDKALDGVRALMTAKPQAYRHLRMAQFPASDPAKRVPDGSADIVLTFRNVHNWRFGGKDKTADAFRQMFAMLRPGGTLGVVDHRLPEDMPDAMEERSGYMKRSSVVRFAEAAGFQLVAESAINANPKDTHDHSIGVWALPPALKLGAQDRERYLAIGESDRMTLRFVKPR